MTLPVTVLEVAIWAK